MKYKLLATDMDGTLLMNNKALSSENIEALRRAKEKGLEIVICTGRPYVTVKPYLEMLGFDCWVVTNNGAIIRNKEGEIVSVTLMEDETLGQVLKILEKDDVDYHVSDEKFTYIRSIGQRIRLIRSFLLQTEMAYWKAYLLSIWAVVFNGSHKKVDFSSFVNKGGRAASVFIYSKDRKKLENLKKEMKKIKRIDLTSSGIDNIEILHENATKGKALERLSNMLNIEKEEMIAVGDNYNDLSMIAYAGLGVAMENGEEEVIEAADWITTTNENHGIAHLLENCPDIYEKI
ncbi:Cof-type HAD-IIB family hydrolase [Natronincola ferrireducens]|uniref:Cof subfamily of IIB subfamily of haloacid dehalogenase superfamily/HAD-superfamily hydrolase, subfamily IIB n=1 Tax=Natronincola ferrireducens TaxID=393762 RepID=A0A1G8ZG96_9FIRM|nr:Cof-type HAD-IIB family hydrolase [Natronincola ferrireducens]SDK13624.1 hypothetical protein SAMN05660472_00838 [Natronincola ferrireducens]